MIFKFFSVNLITLFLSSCFVSDTLSASMRAVGGAATAIPVVGGAIDTVLEVGADAVDTIPL
jgi:hypothetical protein